MQPVPGSSEYTVPFWLPTKSRPAATVGCDQAEVASGNPNAHLSDSFGTCAAVRPARSDDWKRLLASDGAHAGHGDPSGSTIGLAAAQRPIDAPVMSPPSVLALTNSATARRSAPVSCAPCGR